MALTAWCIIVVLVGVLAIGIPVAWLLNGRLPLTESGWIAAPFLGIAVIVLVLQNLVYLRVPINLSAPFLWGGALLLWLWLYRSGQLRIVLARCPRALYAAAVLIYLLHGVGLLLVGARHYVGRAFHDEYNYAAAAQFFMEARFNLKWDQIGNRPWMVWVFERLRHDRIGQSMLQGFFAVSARSEAKALFEPTILLGVPLVVLAVFALARHLRLGRGPALATGAVAGLLPAVAVVHLESFLSQALATPFLLYLLVGLHELSRRPSRGRLAALALVFAAATSIYAEYWPVFVGVTILMLGLASLRHPRRWTLLGSGIVLAASTLLLNPRFTPYLWRIQQTLSAPVLQSVYPWAFQLEGLTCLWVGDVVQQSSPSLWHGLARAWGLAATALGYFGLLGACWRSIGHAPAQRRTVREWLGLSLAVSALAVALLPLTILARDDQHPYQFYKLLLTACPLLVLGLALLCLSWLKPATARVSGEAARPPLLPALFVLGVAGAVALTGTLAMALQTTRLEPWPRSYAPLLIGAGAREAQERLEALKNAEVLIAVPYGRGHQYRNGWLAYFARHNRVWVADPTINDGDVERLGNPGGSFVRTGDHLPQGTLLLTCTGNFRPGPLGAGQLIWGNETYQLWRPGPGPWALPLCERRRGCGPEGVLGPPACCLNQAVTELEILASDPGAVRLTGKLCARAGPAPAARLRIQTSGGYACESAIHGEEALLSVPVMAGKNVITLTPLEGPDSAAPGNAAPARPPVVVEGAGFRWSTSHRHVTTSNPGAPLPA